MIKLFLLAVCIISVCKGQLDNHPQTDSSDEVIVHNIQLCNNETYWTPDKLAQVKQYPNPRFERATSDIKVKVYDTSDNVWSSENLKSVQPAPMPKLDADATSKLGIKQTATHLLSGTRTKMSVQQADVTEKPYSAMGKLLFMDTAGNHYECSGQFIDVNLVLTAGHCVYSLETNGWNKHFKFIQQYVGDVTGLRTSNFKGTPRRVLKAVVSKRWFAGGSENFAYDFALLTMGDSSIADHLTIAYPDDFESWIAAGYPSNYKNGQILQKFKGSKGSVTADVVETPYDPMGPGCSGGAWIAQKGSEYFAVGLNSFSIEGRESMFSPRFTSSRINQVLNRAKTELKSTT